MPIRGNKIPRPSLRHEGASSMLRISSSDATISARIISEFRFTAAGNHSTLVYREF
jgi:hypothetical protein